MKYTIIASCPGAQGYEYAWKLSVMYVHMRAVGPILAAEVSPGISIIQPYTLFIANP